MSGPVLKDIRPDAPMRTFVEEKRRAVARYGERFGNDPSAFVVNERCPLCGAAESVEFGPAAFTRYMRCSECGLRYLRDEPLLEHRLGLAVASLAADAAVKDVQIATYEARKRKFLPIIERLGAFHPIDEPARVLDIGSGSGYFLEALRERTAWQGVGLEPNGEAVAAATRRGLDVRQGDLASFTPDEPFDIAVCVGVLGHISSPAQVAGDCGRMVRDGGIFFARTPNCDGFEMSVLGTAHSYFTPLEGMAGYTLPSMETFLRIGGFEVLELSTPGALDLNIVRQHVEVFGCALDAGPFLHRLIFEDSEEMEAARKDFTRFLAANRMSSLMQAVGRKVPGAGVRGK